MRRYLYLILLLLVMPALGSAREAWRGWCEQGAKHVITSGLTSTTTVQLSSGSCQVTVYVTGGGLATLYADNNGTVKANPFTADTNGQWIFFADNGTYDVTTSSATLGTVTYSNVLLCDPAVMGAACGSGGGIGNINVYKNGTLVGTEPGVDFIEGTNVTIDPATDDPPTKVHLTLNSAEQVALAGTLVGIEPRINFIQGTGVTLTVADNTGVSPPRIDVTVASSAGTGTVTTFSAGTLSPIFTTSVATATSTPALTFALSTAGAHTFLGNNTGSTAAPSYVQPAFTDFTGSLSCAQLPALTGDVTSSAGSCATTIATNVKRRGLSFTIGVPGATALTAGATTTDYLTVPFACTISAYNLAIDAGTVTVKFWKIATGTAIPTSSNSINTSGVGISSGTAIHSTSLGDFTTTTVTANDILAMNVTAAATIAYINGVLQCDE